VKVDWRAVSLLGIDVGFSATRASTGIAQYRFGEGVRLDCARSSPAHRAAVLAHDHAFDAIAIDGPIVPEPALLTARTCEQMLARKPFSRNCMAGYSHFGTGLLLRQAATEIAHEMRPRLRAHSSPLVEAFPNAFLAVLLDQAAIDTARPILRGTKSDVFYQNAVANGALIRLLDHLRWHDEALRAQVVALAADRSRAAHEHRAAMVCLLTAGCALSNNCERIGDAAGGFIHLPPRALWAEWARGA
jgi:hypothetical protein